MTFASRGLRLELHRHGADRAEDLTARVLRSSEIHGRIAPWGGLDVSLDVPAADWSLLPGTGDWLALRDARTGVAHQLTRVTSEPTGVSARGARVETNVAQVTSETWLDYLGRIKAYTTARPTVGTLFSTSDWDAIVGLANALSDGNIGYVLGRVLQRLANVLLPKTLGGGRLGDAVRVAFDDATAKRFSRRPVEGVRGSHIRWEDGGLSDDWSGPTVLDLLLGTFWTAREIIELFPTVEPLSGTEAVAPGVAERWTAIPAPARAVLGMALERSTLGASLGAHLALIYRVVPWRVKPLGPAASVGGLFDDRATWFALARHRIEQDEVADLDASRNDDARINAVTADILRVGSHHDQLMHENGLPIMDPESVARHGLRLYDPQWFFHEDTTRSLKDATRTVAAQAAQFMLGAERFYAGSVMLNRLRRDIRHGEVVEVQLHKGKVLTAYVDRVQHVVTAGPAIEGTTTVFFSRGLYDERQRDVQVPIVIPAAVPTERQHVQRESSPGGAILFRGELLPIAWDNVRLFTHGDGLALDAGFSTSSRKAEAIDLAVLHWDVTTSAARTRRVLANKNISTHFVIDWDGTIYQLVDMTHATWHAESLNGRAIGIDLNTPVWPLSRNDQLVAAGHPARPVVEGWRVRGQVIKPFLGFHEVQLSALRALAAALYAHLGIPLVAPASTAPDQKSLTTLTNLSSLAPGWYHHAEVSTQKIDTAGVWLPTLLAETGPFLQSGVG